jgi:hypothetical protein
MDIHTRVCAIIHIILGMMLTGARPWPDDVKNEGQT